MEISDSNVGIGQQAYVKEIDSVKPSGVNQAEANKVNTPEDRVSLSKDARDMQIAKNAVDESPDVREETVQNIKNEVDNSTYKVDSQQIADKMIGSIINKVV